MSPPTLEQLKYLPQPFPERPQLSRKVVRDANADMLADQTFSRKAFPPFKPQIFTERTVRTPQFKEMEPFPRPPYIPYELRRNVYPGASNLPLYLRGD